MRKPPPIERMVARRLRLHFFRLQRPVFFSFALLCLLALFSLFREQAAELEAEVAKFADSDPDRLKQLQKGTEVAIAAANRWTGHTQHNKTNQRKFAESCEHARAERCRATQLNSSSRPLLLSSLRSDNLQTLISAIREQRPEMEEAKVSSAVWNKGRGRTHTRTDRSTHPFHLPGCCCAASRFSRIWDWTRRSTTSRERAICTHALSSSMLTNFVQLPFIQQARAASRMRLGLRLCLARSLDLPSRIFTLFQQFCFIVYSLDQLQNIHLK